MLLTEIGDNNIMVIQFYDVILRASEETVNENQTI